MGSTVPTGFSCPWCPMDTAHWCKWILDLTFSVATLMGEHVTNIDDVKVRVANRLNVSTFSLSILSLWLGQWLLQNWWLRVYGTSHLTFSDEVLSDAHMDRLEVAYTLPWMPEMNDLHYSLCPSRSQQMCGIWWFLMLRKQGSMPLTWTKPSKVLLEERPTWLAFVALWES